MNLQKGALGLLGAFSLKVLGRNPPLFGDQVTPVVDVYDQYLAAGELVVVRSALATLLQTTNGATLTVPNGKCWRLIAASFTGALNAADNALVSESSIGIATPNSSPFSVLIAAGASITGALPRHVAVVMRPPIFLSAGFQVQFSITTSVAITVTSNLQLGVLVQEFDQ